MTRGVETGGALAAALDAIADAALDGAVDVGAVEADATPLDVPAVGVVDEGAAEDATGVDVDVLACLEFEVHAAAKVASATSVTACIRDGVSTGLLNMVRSTIRRPGRKLGCAGGEGEAG